MGPLLLVGRFLLRHWAVFVAGAAGAALAWSLQSHRIESLQQDVAQAQAEQRTAWATVKTQSDAVLAFKARAEADAARGNAALAKAQKDAAVWQRKARELIDQPRPPGLTPCENACRILNEVQL